MMDDGRVFMVGVAAALLLLATVVEAVIIAEIVTGEQYAAAGLLEEDQYRIVPASCGCSCEIGRKE